LFLFHRWAGIGLCLLFALWFLSGMFMMYVDFPQLTAPERRAGQPLLDFSGARIAPGEAVGRLSAADFRVAGHPDENGPSTVPADSPLTVSQVSLGMLLGRPVYYIRVKGNAQTRAVFADTGEVLREVTPAMARAVAADFAVRAGWIADQSRVAFDSLLQTDQWSVSSGLNAHRPLLRVSLGDAAGTDLYVSSTTGEVVRDTHRTERLLNYFAAVTHWIYPTVLRKHVDAWDWVVDIVSGAGVVLAVSGLWIGILRWRWRRPPGKRAIPYRGLMRWHFITGAVFGTLALTWVFSGLLSMNPGSLNPPRSPSAAERLVFSGKPLTLGDFALPSWAGSADVVEASLLHYDGQAFYDVVRRDGVRALYPAGRDDIRPARYAAGLDDTRSTPSVAGRDDLRSAPSAGALLVRLPDAAAVLARVPALIPSAALHDAAVLTDYDDYYYTRHEERADRPLPVVRARFSDPSTTWFYVDPRSGEVLERSTYFNRVYRWLYNGLHSWDFPWLWRHRPLWDVVVIAFSLGGLTLSLLGVVVGIRRLRYDLRRYASQVS